MANVAKQKAILRRALLSTRAALDPRQVAVAGQAVIAHLEEAPWFRSASTVGLYAATRGEIPLSELIAHDLGEKRTFAFPRVEKGTRRLSFWRLAPGASLAPSPLGIPEPLPDPELEVPLEALELILVPGVAFDPEGTRLGQGGGYYDVTLQETHALRVGIAHPFQLVSALPRAPHDIPVDLIVTPSGVLRPPGKAAN